MNEVLKVAEVEVPSGIDGGELALRGATEVAPATRAEAGAVGFAILELARDPSFNPDNLRALVDMQNSMEDRQAQREIRQAEREFNQAFVRLQGKLPRIRRDGNLEYPKDKGKPDGEKYTIAKFAKWETIDAAIRPILTEEGFGLSFRISPRAGDGGGLNVSAVLRHTGGHKEVGDPMPVPLDTSGGKNNLQGYGSSLSYGKKYAAFAALNLVTEGEDDDGKRGGMKFITPEQVGELADLCKRAGRVEIQFVERLSQGTLHAFHEIEDGPFFLAAKGTLEGIIHQRTKAGA